LVYSDLFNKKMTQRVENSFAGLEICH